MRFRSTIKLTSIVVSLFLLVLGVSGASYVYQLQRRNSRIMDENVSSVRAAEQLGVVLQNIRHELDWFLVSHDREHLVRALEMKGDVDTRLDQAEELSTLPREKALVVDIRQRLDEFFALVRPIVDESADRVSSAVVKSLVEDVLSEHVLTSAHQYLDLNERELQNSNQANKAMANSLALALLLLGTCGAIAGLVAGYGVARGISRSIFQLSVPIRDVAGKLNEVVGPIAVSADPSVEELETMLENVSAQVAAVIEQLHERHREVIRADQLAAVGQLAAGLAHELRNPLMCMKVLVQSATRRGGHATLDARDLQVLNEEIVRLETLLQTFMDFARPAQLEKQEADLASIARQTVDLLSGKAERRNVTIDCRSSEEQLTVEADAAQLRQVVLNLLLNALDAVPNGGKVWVEAIRDNGGRGDPETDGESQPHVCLRVADNGRGLPKEERNRLFEPFFSTKETGVGLGLAICQRIIHAHGGELAANDREGGGAVFEVILPFKPVPCGT